MSSARHLRTPAKHRKRTLPKGPLALIAAGALVAGGGAIGSAAATETVLVNPLAGAAGFTVVSLGDLEMSNHEIEGSFAAAGDLRTTSDHPYNVIQVAAGSPSYTLPEYNGMPVRLVLGGTFDVAGSTAMIRVSSSGSSAPATEGRVVIGDATGLNVSGRGAGVCIQAADRNDCSGPVIEQSAYPQTPASAVDPAAFSALITPTGIADMTTAAERIAAGALADTVETPGLGGSGMERSLQLVEGHTNVWILDPADLPTGDCKRRFDGAVPSATTPLDIRVQAAEGATVNLPMETIGAYSGPGGSRANLYAPYMLWNIEQTEGATVNLVGNGIIPGSFLAPTSRLVTPDHNSKTLIEGQVVAGEIVFRHAGEVHHYGFASDLAFEVDGDSDGGDSDGDGGTGDGGTGDGGTGDGDSDSDASTGDNTDTGSGDSGEASTGADDSDSGVLAAGDAALAVAGSQSALLMGAGALLAVAGALLLATGRRAAKRIA